MKTSNVILGTLLLALLGACGREQSLSNDSANQNTRGIIGSKMNPLDYLKIRSDYASVRRLNGYLCSATIIGPNTMITAAHCTLSGGGVSGKIETKNKDGTEKKYSVLDNTGRIGDCNVSPELDGKPFGNLGWDGHDLALCLFRGRSFEVRHETISFSEVKAGDTVKIAGFGPPAPVPIPGLSLIVADMVVDYNFDVAKSLSKYDFTNPFGSDVQTVGGDSGGPAFKYINGRRYLVGVAHSSAPDDTIPKIWQSFFVSLSKSYSQVWIKDWAHAHNAKICGVNYTNPKCQ